MWSHLASPWFPCGHPGPCADNENPDSRVMDKYFKGTGTSMSAALTSGLVAGLRR